MTQPPTAGVRAGTSPVPAASLLFAYGSNTDLDHLETWCRDHGFGARLFRPAGLAAMPDVELAFNHYSRSRAGGALNLRSRPGNLVAGLLLEVRPAGWVALDRKEGVRSGAYRRVLRHVVGPRGDALPVSAYIAAPEREDAWHAPAPGYVDTVLAGYAAAGIDPRQLQAAAAGAPLEPFPDGVFVYGTLMRGETRAAAVVEGRPSCVLLAHAPGSLVDLGAYPAMVLEHRPGRSGHGWVQGEFVRFPDIGAALRRLDAIEGAGPFGAPGGLYRRTVVEVGVGDGRSRPAWAYVMDSDATEGRPSITSGCWRSQRGRRDTALGRILAAHMARCPDFLERLAAEVRSPFQPEAPPPFPVTVEGIVGALASGDLSERGLARASGEWAALPA